MHGFSTFAARVVAETVAALPAVITMGGTDYDCTLDPSALSQSLEGMGMDQEQTLEVLVPNTENMTPANGRTVTITTTTTDALEGTTFTIAGITAHPNLPAKIITLTRRP